MTPEELALLVAKRSSDVPSSERVQLRRSFDVDLKASAIEDNSITVVASTMGTADDRCGDVIFPGAYKKCLPGFLVNGFVALGHDWGGLPVAIPTACKEMGNQLVSTATFHSTQEAQDARTICKERMDAGKSVSVSVGFMPDYSDPDGVVWFEKGSDLLAWAKGKGFDTSLFDDKGIAKLGWCRAITKIAELFEWSIVGVGCNTGAKAVAVKSAALEGKTFDQQFEEALGCLHSLADRWADIADNRKALGEGHRVKLLSLLEALTPIAEKSDPALGAVVTDAPPDDLESRILDLRIAALL